AERPEDLRTYSVTNPGYMEGFDENLARQEMLESVGAEIIRVSSHNGLLDLPSVLAELARRQLTSVIVEGGAEVAGSFIEQKLIDKATFFFAPKIIGGRDAFPAIGGSGIERLSEVLKLRDLEIRQCGEDWEVTGYPE
ncbi:MAG TPA: dihydrofolate reductase family protein, partial [Blastocatellia bacterium]|nr:dihydrofolate reductase family protein [Blastocatellia bacterium]